MFGRGRFQNGVLVDPKPPFAFDPKDEAKLEAFRGLIWRVYVSSYPPLVSQLKIQADSGAVECLRTATLSLVQRGAYVYLPSRYSAHRGYCPDDNCGIAIQTIRVYGEDDGAQASNPQGL